MNRPWKIWLVFGACAAVVLAAMGWISVTALRLDRLQLQASQHAELEERVRLALWRMDSALTPLIVEESARPGSAYDAFSATERAYTKGGAGYNPARQGEVLVPSPLLGLSSSNVLLHFQLIPGGPLTSPQAPLGEQRKLAETGYISRGAIERASARLQELREVLNEENAASVDIASPQGMPRRAARPMPALNNVSSVKQTFRVRNEDLLVREAGLPIDIMAANPPGQVLALNNDFRQVKEVQQLRNTAEYAQRANVYQQAQQQAADVNRQQVPLMQPAPQPPAQGEGIFRPLWLGSSLVLARRMNQAGNFVVQGVWLNWTNLRASLVGSVRDLLPGADLQPVSRANDDRQARMLAALPVKLVPGAVPSAPLPVWTPVRVSLVLAWGCVLLAALAVARLLHGTLSLSERRAAFVSAVTHELRTPLTTFKMYSEMLAEGMVPDEARRRQYLETLCSEANRLSHLVENVLAYARLERGSARSRVEHVSLGELIARVKPRLVERAGLAGMTLTEDADPRALQTVVHVDVSAVEQILFNLVDNACKYAAPTAAEKIIHLEALPDKGKRGMLRVRDHGHGISPEAARRLFQPFNKSAQEAARTAPGVGLGLALCRRLSRAMGGDLRWDALVKDGACFVLTLPLGSAQ
jgi:signal transduction histidine kinase